MKIGILREEKTPPDRRVPLSPEQCKKVEQLFPGTQIVVQPSLIRCFPDEQYREQGVQVSENLNDCDILLGVKEVKPENIIEGKTYLFFSHTIKKQAYNRSLLQAALRKKIRLVDYEVLTNADGLRLIGFGRFAGLVGTYNGLRAYGLKYKLFDLKPAHQCFNYDEMLEQLDSIKLPPVKIAVTGNGRVAGGVLEILNYLNVMRISPEAYLNTPLPRQAVFVQLLPNNYARHREGKEFKLLHFFNHPEEYENTFLPFARSTDLLIAAAYWDPKAPVLFTAEDARQNDFRIRVISDITCDIEGSIPSTKRPATIDEPFYDYNRQKEALEAPFSSPENITVQAVDNLPCELPKDASLDFGQNLIEKVFPSLLGEDKDGIIERASITLNGKLTPRFSYLSDFAAGI